MLRRLSVLLCTLCALVAVRADELDDNESIYADEVVAFVRQGQCAAAVRSLNQLLDKPDVATLLVAGVMHEEGACVARDWSRAERFYLRAAATNSRRAALYLAASYATAAAGPDLAAALWWAHKGNAPRPDACHVSGFTAQMDPDVFVEVIRKWGVQTVAACAYVAGVLAGTIGESHYPVRALRLSEQGAIDLRFVPASGTFFATLKVDNVVEEVRRWQVGDTIDGNNKELLPYVRNATLRAAKRIGVPQAIPPLLEAGMTMVFRIQ